MPPSQRSVRQLLTRCGVPRILCLHVPVLGMVFKPGTCGFKRRSALTEADGIIDLPFGLVAMHDGRRREVWQLVARTADRARRALWKVGAALDRLERRLRDLYWAADERAHPNRGGVPF